MHFIFLFYFAHHYLLKHAHYYLQEEKKCLCGLCDEDTNTCVNGTGNFRPTFFALNYTGVPEDAPSAISVFVKGTNGCQFKNIEPDVGFLNAGDNIYFVDIGSTCGTGGDLNVFNGTDFSGEKIGYIHISCSQPLYIGLAFVDQDPPTSFGPFTLIGSCFATQGGNVFPPDINTPSCVGQCDGIIQPGFCT